MKIIIPIFLLLVYNPLISQAQTKKEQIEILKQKIDSIVMAFDSSTKAHAFETNNLKQKMLDFKIKIKKQQDSLILFSNEIADLKNIVKQKNYELDELSDSIRTLNHKIDIATYSRDLYITDFGLFIKEFINKTMSGKSFDSLVYVKSESVMRYTSNQIGFARFYNMGAFCEIFELDGFGYDGPSMYGGVYDDLSKLPIISNKSPDDGYCEEAKTKDGIYYMEVNQLPEGYDVIEGKYEPVPEILKNLNKKIIRIQKDKWVIKTLYFVYYNGRWVFLYIDDCDCSA